MSDYVTNLNSSSGIASATFSQISEAQNREGQRGRQIVIDTMTIAQKNGKQSKDPTAGPPVLEPGQSKNPDYLIVVAKALSSAFLSMEQSTIEQNKSFVALQQYDQTMSQIGLRSAQIAIKQEANELAKIKHLQHVQKKAKKRDEIVKWVTFGVTLAVIVGVIGITIFATPETAGGSDILVPEEVELGVGAAEGAEAGDTTAEAGEGASAESSGGASSSSSSSDEEMTGVNADTPSYMTATQDMMNSNTVTQQQIDESLEETEMQEFDKDDIEESQSPQKSSLKTTLTGFARGGAGAVLAGFTGLPMLIQGIGDFELADSNRELANAQKNVGTAMANMQVIEGYDEFYQELTQRTSSVLTEEIGSTTDVLQTYSDIVKAYRTIATNLANAV